jgi:hypothetical protein
MSCGEASRASEWGLRIRRQFEDVFVLLEGEGFAERLDVFEETTALFSGSDSSSLLRPERSRPLCLASSSRRLRFYASNASARFLPRKREAACGSRAIR